MKILFYFGHPAQYLFVKNTLIQLNNNSNIDFKIIIKTKDVLEQLINSDNLPFENIYKKTRGNNKFSIVLSLISRIFKVFKIAIKYKPTLFWGGDPSIAIVSKVLRKDCIIVGEDDYKVIHKLAKITFPYATAILFPNVCDVGPYNYKKIGYEGYMKLAYLHPNVFELNKNVLEKYVNTSNYILIRLSELKAYHDAGIGGFTEEILNELIALFEEKKIKFYISAEGAINEKYDKYLLKPKPIDMVHILAGATLFIGDSQSMTVEACMLGIPSVRFSDFAGKISVLEELEHKYGLTYGIPCRDKEDLFSKTRSLLNDKHIKEEFQKRKQIMLSEKINVSGFITDLIVNYPAVLKSIRSHK
jgi:predicted glycosyltransferase